jgi:hypothetical protein
MSVALKITKEIEFNVGRDAEQVVGGFKIENTSKDVVAYKVKTTAPKRYSVRPNTGIVTPGDTVQVKVTLNWAKEPKRDSEPDKFQILSVLVNISGDKKPPKPDDDSYSDYIRRLWKAATPDKIFKDRLKIVIKKDPNARDTGSARPLSLGNNLSFSGERNRDDNRLSLDRRRDSYRMEGGTSTLNNSMDPRNSRSLDRLRTSTNTNERPPRESSRAPPDRGREGSRTQMERPRESSRAPSERRESSRAPPERRESSRAPPERRESSRTPLDRTTSERGASRSLRDISRSRDSSMGPPQDRERSRSRSAYFDGYYSDRERSRTRDRSIPPSSRESSRVRSFEREDRGRSGYDYERSRSRSTSRLRERSPDDSYRSSREASVSRSRSRSRARDERSRSRTREEYDDYYYGYDRKQDYMMRPRTDERPQVRREIDSLFRKYEDLNSKTAQKTQERQLLFIALAFFIGFIFAQAFFY